MKDGFIKVAAGTPQIRVADCRYNAEQIFYPHAGGRPPGGAGALPARTVPDRLHLRRPVFAGHPAGRAERGWPPFWRPPETWIWSPPWACRCGTPGTTSCTTARLSSIKGNFRSDPQAQHPQLRRILRGPLVCLRRRQGSSDLSVRDSRSAWTPTLHSAVRPCPRWSSVWRSARTCGRPSRPPPPWPGAAPPSS